jgi:hypothetical protein
MHFTPISPILAGAVSIDGKTLALLLFIGLVIFVAGAVIVLVGCIAAYRGGKGSLPALVLSVAIMVLLAILTESEPGLRAGLVVPVILFFFGRSKRFG